MTRRMAGRGRAGRTVVLRLRFGDYTQATRSRSLAVATADPTAIGWVAQALLRDQAEAIARRGLTRVGITISAIETEDHAQLSFDLGPR